MQTILGAGGAVSTELVRELAQARQQVRPVECLLDLHEARLESQAKEFLDFFMKRNSAGLPDNVRANTSA